MVLWDFDNKVAYKATVRKFVSYISATEYIGATSQHLARAGEYRVISTLGSFALAYFIFDSYFIVNMDAHKSI